MLAIIFSACGNSAATNNSMMENAANQSNAAVVVNSETEAENSNASVSDNKNTSTGDTADNKNSSPATPIDRTEADPIPGEYIIGDKKCTILPTKDGYAYEFRCADKKVLKVKVYYVEYEGNDNEIIFTNKEGVEQGKFILKDEKFVSGKFTDESGKELEVRLAE